MKTDYVFYVQPLIRPELCSELRDLPYGRVCLSSGNTGLVAFRRTGIPVNFVTLFGSVLGCIDALLSD